jgi:predicted nucleic acid-binding protein
MAHSECLWLDSDIILDWLAHRQPWDAAAKELLKRSAQGEWDICFSPLTLANVHYVYRKQAGAAKALMAIRNLVKLGMEISMEANHVQQALATGPRDFEDELQIACASQIAGLSAIITRNLPDYQHAPVPILTAEAWLAQHPAE